MSILDKRINYKPFEYPELLIYPEAIRKQYWDVSELTFTADKLDYHSKLEEHQKIYTKRALLCVSQIEVDVKLMWQNMYLLFPKPEINGLGVSMGESEFRHSEAYSELGDVLGYNNELSTVLDIPQFKKLHDFLGKHLTSNDPFDKVGVFTLLIEKGLLFGMFAIPYSLTRFEGVMKNISNVIAWTSVDEEIHAQAGAALLNILQREFPFTKEEKIQRQAHFDELLHEFIEIESELLDWVFEHGESKYLTKLDLLNFVKRRIDMGLQDINFDPVFNITEKEYEPMEWYDEEIFADTLDDFFAKRPVEYTKHDISITSDDLY